MKIRIPVVYDSTGHWYADAEGWASLAPRGDADVLSDLWAMGVEFELPPTVAWITAELAELPYVLPEEIVGTVE